MAERNTSDGPWSGESDTGEVRSWELEPTGDPAAGCLDGEAVDPLARRPEFGSTGEMLGQVRRGEVPLSALRPKWRAAWDTAMVAGPGGAPAEPQARGGQSGARRKATPAEPHHFYIRSIDDPKESDKILCEILRFSKPPFNLDATRIARRLQARLGDDEPQRPSTVRHWLAQARRMRAEGILTDP